MKRFLLLLVGLALVPAAWGCLRALADTVAAMPLPEDALFPASACAALCGLVAFLAVWFAFPKPVRAYVLGHELTHAFWALMCGAKVSGLKVGARGGSVKVSKSNLIITLSPYFFPFYTVVVVLLALAARAVWDPLPCPWLWTGLVGFTWCFHCCFTIQSLAQRQPDILEYGRVFSWTLILIVNVVGVIAWLTVTAPVHPRVSGGALCRRVAEAYASLRV